MAKVAIIGSGFIGRAWAISFARAGHDIVLWDADLTAPTAALSYIETVLPDLATNDLLGGRLPADIRARMRAVARIASPVRVTAAGTSSTLHATTRIVRDPATGARLRVHEFQ